MEMSVTDRLALAQRLTSDADRIVADHHFLDSELIGTLLDVQVQFNYLPHHVLERVAAQLEVPLSRLYGLATFYRGFSLTPRGRHTIHVCLGTACHVRGARRVYDSLLGRLKVRPRGTTRDFRFSVDTVRCLGCCSLSPVVQIDAAVFGRMRPDDLPGVLDRFE